jgi:hypothetical protein
MKGEEESELIQILFKKYKLAELADEIVKDFRDLPQLEKIVVWKAPIGNIVVEGNRRLAVYKCLSKPSKIQDPTIRSKFEVLKKKIKIDDNYKIEAVVTTKREEAIKYVERKHIQGNNESAWGENERHHHVSRNREGVAEDKLTFEEMKSIHRVKLGEMVRRTGLPEIMKRDILDKGHVTLFYRVIDSTPARAIFKYEKVGKDLSFDDETKFIAQLTVVVFELLRKRTIGGDKLDSRTLNTEDQIREYLLSISKAKIEQVSTILEEELQRGKAASGKTKQNRKKSKNKAKRPFFVPRSEKKKFENPEDIKDLIRFILVRFNEFRGPATEVYRKTKVLLKLENEYDVQQLLFSIFKLFIDDTRREEPTPSLAGTSSKCDIFLCSDEIVIEVKMTRRGLKTNKEVSDELMSDVNRYNKHPQCKLVFFFVFDPNRDIKNPRVFEGDINKLATKNEMKIETYVCQS